MLKSAVRITAGYALHLLFNGRIHEATFALNRSSAAGTMSAEGGSAMIELGR